MSLADRHRRAAAIAGVDLAGVRRACGITQETVAAALGVSRRTVSAWEHRQWGPTEAYCRVIAGLQRHLEVAR
jgi:DNA-binding transcriptional regulator YiaG